MRSWRDEKDPNDSERSTYVRYPHAKTPASPAASDEIGPGMWTDKIGLAGGWGGPAPTDEIGLGGPALDV
jgi:hypothetical protein